MNLFLLNLAISDLLHLCTGPLLYLFKRNSIVTNYYLGKIGCFASPFFRGNYVVLLWNLNFGLRFIKHRELFSGRYWNSSLYIPSLILISVTFLVAGALNLTIISLNKVIGIMMPKVANVLISNRCIVYATLVSIWAISVVSAVWSFFFKEYNVSYLKFHKINK